MANQDIYKQITDTLISEMQKGNVPWQQPWISKGLPRNLKTDKQYRGINTFILGLQPYSSKYWATFNQISSLGGKVKKGEKSTQIVFWSTFDKVDSEGNDKTVWYLKLYRVFNIDQTTGLEDHKLIQAEQTDQYLNNVIERNEKCDSVFTNWTSHPRLNHNHCEASYTPKTDTVNMPPKTSFTSTEGYYSTLYHESVHATGHKSRLARPGIVGTINFGSDKYSKEELVAEFGAAFLCAHTGIENKATIQNHTAYLQSWIKSFKNDPKMAMQAASQAQKAVDHILGN